VNKGIVLGPHLETTAAGVYAAGDAVETDDILLGQKAVHALWPVAVEQARCAAQNMVEQETWYPGDVFRNILTVFGLTVFTGGESTRDEGDVYRDTSDGQYRKILVRNGRLRGYVFVGEGVNNPGVYLRMMKEQTDISSLLRPVLQGTVASADLYPSVFRAAL
ncbi:MAG TPA: hypothetical protein PLZ61_08095, partial [Candidatus Cryosericum sp.]|nr:hypothetical protein [Candidatus Cryosericum sp.]